MFALGLVVAGPPATAPTNFAAPPSRCETGETACLRQLSTRPPATPPIINDGDETKCAICLEKFACHEKVWRLECGHIFHALCWGRVAQGRVGRRLE
eukprot:5284120-Pyramimonas_sp.AAC.1